jgi:hypothetical protein
MNEMPNKFYNPIKTKIKFKAIKIVPYQLCLRKQMDGKEGRKQ